MYRLYSEYDTSEYAVNYDNLIVDTCDKTAVHNVATMGNVQVAYRGDAYALGEATMLTSDLLSTAVSSAGFRCCPFTRHRALHSRAM